MFNNKVPIGHDKFAVYVKDGLAKAVMTGSTNWTETGLCTQSNNSIIIENGDVAEFYYDFWKRLHADIQPKRKPVTVKTHKMTIKGAAPNNAIQGPALRHGICIPSALSASPTASRKSTCGSRRTRRPRPRTTILRCLAI